TNLQEGNVRIFDEHKKGLLVKEVFYLEGQRIIYGLLEGGEFGEAQEIINKETGEKTKTKEKDEIPLSPYYFLIYIPVNSDKGILLLEKISQYGIKSYFEDILKNGLKNKVYGFTLYIHPIVLKDVLEEVFSHEIAKIRVIKNKIPMDIADKYKIRGNEAYEEISFVARRNRSFLPEYFKDIKDKLIKGEKVSFIEIVPNINEKEINKVKIEFKLPNNKRRTVSITDIVNIKSDFILDDITLSENGFPKFDKIHEEALSLLETIQEAIYEQ
ncbi:hypothetical protein, partial [Hydrogenivirga sp. 128-5-R1-1]|uniref:hypothetical protein n=1 Tax=Hydrogenivirga sp. 128-5-R1-1 TaxID=392423 RepID=UPI00015F2EDB